MPARAPYRSPVRAERAAQTRRRILEAVGELLTEGVFHDCTVEEVADRAGVSRATLYQHFGSRLELVDGVCDLMGTNPALLAIRESVALPDPDQALANTIAGSMRFWASEDKLLEQLYGVVAVDPAARAFVDRQRADRRGELERLARRIGRPKQALATLLVLTSYETYCELKQAGMSERETTRFLQDSARKLLLDADD
jgi:AcrR family transcriptional regulator